MGIIRDVFCDPDTELFPLSDKPIWRAVRIAIAELESKLATETERAERAEKVAVWAVQRDAGLDGDNGVLHYFNPFGEVECDGTDAGIYAALLRAMEGK